MLRYVESLNNSKIFLASPNLLQTKVQLRHNCSLGHGNQNKQKNVKNCTYIITNTMIQFAQGFEPPCSCTLNPQVIFF